MNVKYFFAERPAHDEFTQRKFKVWTNVEEFCDALIIEFESFLGGVWVY